MSCLVCHLVIQKAVIIELTVNGNNYDQFQEIDPDINYYKDTFTCKYYDVSQFDKLKKKSNVIAFIHTKRPMHNNAWKFITKTYNT